MFTIGLDIGGAHIKTADTGRNVSVRPFAIWKTPEQLPHVLAEELAAFGPANLLAVTMTAELADCFRTKAEGVDAVLRAVESVAGAARVVVWQTGAEFVEPEVAREIPLLVAAANWHALATWVGRLVPHGKSILIDIGSTTTDIVPLSSGVPVPHGLTDRQRLQEGELVYSGIGRTPVCAIAQSVPLAGGNTPVAAELFATTRDVYLMLGRIAENPDDDETANGRPATVTAAHERLARMVCCDTAELSRDEATDMAQYLAKKQKQQISCALDRVLKAMPDRCAGLLLSGSGTFLAEEIVRDHPDLSNVQTTRLSDIFEAGTSEAACAIAVAHLAEERVMPLD